MKKVLSLSVIVLLLSLFLFSLSFAEYSNYAAPQLEYISNAFPLLWGKPKAEILRIMSLFPDYTCTDYGDQVGCASRFNTNSNNNIFLSFFTVDYEERYDNLWKTALTVDLQSAEQIQDLLRILWLDGLKPFHTEEDDFSAAGALPLYFSNDRTTAVYYVQVFKPDNNPYLLAEFYDTSVH